MPRAAVLQRRSPVDWGVRAAFALAAAWVGYCAVSHSLALSMRTISPERAHLLAPGDGRITATLSAARSGPDATPSDRKAADQLARMALRQDPTAEAAAATLGINAQLRGDTAGARRLFAYADRLSRRDLRTRLWAIEDAVARNDIRGALRNYDIALRTSKFAPSLLYPVLANAISDPAISAELISTLRTRPIWTQDFVRYLPGSDADPEAVAQLLREIANRNVDVPQPVRAAAINKLVAAGKLEDAWNYYRTLHPSAPRDRSRQPRFSRTSATPPYFDWVLTTGHSGISATIQPSQDAGLFDFSVPPTVGGELLQQLQLLPPGRYVLDGHSIGIDQPTESRPYWTLRCRDGRELGRIIVPNSADNSGRFGGSFVVPADCPAQYLVLLARPSDRMNGVEGQIDYVLLQPAT